MGNEPVINYENNSPSYPWTTDDVDSLFQSFDNSFHEEVK